MTTALIRAKAQVEAYDHSIAVMEQAVSEMMRYTVVGGEEIAITFMEKAISEMMEKRAVLMYDDRLLKEAKEPKRRRRRPTACHCGLSKAPKAKKPAKNDMAREVIISVDGGVASVEACPDDVVVSIQDHDVEDDDAEDDDAE